jgi:O-antigen/teichoic acid export membrane protein
LFDQGFLSLFYAKLFSSLVFLVLTIFFVYRKFIVFSLRYSWTTVRSLFKEAYPIALFSLILIASIKVGVFFLKYFRGSSEVGLFEASHRLILQLQFIPMSITFSIFPFLSRAADDHSKSLSIYYKRTLKYYYILSIFPISLMVLGSEEIINLLFGEKFLRSAISLKILAWTFIFLSMESLQYNILIILGKQKLSIISVTACFISNAILGIILIPHYGYTGASIATFIAFFVLFAFSSYFVSINIGKINILTIFLKPTISIIFTSIAFYFILNKTIISLFMAALIGILIYLTTMLKLKTFDKFEIEVIKDFIFRRKKRIVSKKIFDDTDKKT